MIWRNQFQCAWLCRIIVGPAARVEFFLKQNYIFGSSGDLVRDFGAEGELSATKEDAIAVVFKAPKSSG
jgi:hypothetical protein